MRRRLLMAKASGFVVAVASFPVGAQIFKCPVGEGFAFQQAPCPGLGASGGRLMVFANGRPAPTETGASSVPKTGRVLGRTPRPAPLAERPLADRNPK
jgi:hypothetical protein